MNRPKFSAISSINFLRMPELAAPPKRIGHYLLLEKIGEGGMGVVWKAQDTRLKRQVALKLLTGAEFCSEERRARSLNEARTASALNHPNIVAVYDVGSDTAVGDYIAMEFVDGQTLARIIPRGGLPERAEAVRPGWCNF